MLDRLLNWWNYTMDELRWNRYARYWLYGGLFMGIIIGKVATIEWTAGLIVCAAILLWVGSVAKQ